MKEFFLFLIKVILIAGTPVLIVFLINKIPKDIVLKKITEFTVTPISRFIENTLNISLSLIFVGMGIYFTVSKEVPSYVPADRQETAVLLGQLGGLIIVGLGCFLFYVLYWKERERLCS